MATDADPHIVIGHLDPSSGDRRNLLIPPQYGEGRDGERRHAINCLQLNGAKPC